MDGDIRTRDPKLVSYIPGHVLPLSLFVRALFRWATSSCKRFINRLHKLSITTYKRGTRTVVADEEQMTATFFFFSSFVLLFSFLSFFSSSFFFFLSFNVSGLLACVCCVCRIQYDDGVVYCISTPVIAL